MLFINQILIVYFPVVNIGIGVRQGLGKLQKQLNLIREKVVGHLLKPNY